MQGVAVSPGALAPDPVQILLPLWESRGSSSFHCGYTGGETEAQGSFFLILSFAASLWGLCHRSGFRPKAPGRTVLAFP